MKVGIPKGLLYYTYHPFLQTFFSELGAEIITSSDTNKKILDEGIKYSVDEACLPVKIFHGHVSSLKDKCDIIVIPRIMQVREREYICPKFCGLPEMILNSIPDITETITEPIYAISKRRLYSWAEEAGSKITKDSSRIRKAFSMALDEQKSHKQGIKDENYKFRVALAGHPYNIYDNFINMNIVQKLNELGVGVITEEHVDDESIDLEVKKLYKRPFWTFARNSYGFTVYGSREGLFDGIIYISSFACGIDSVVVELIKDKIGEFPFMILKVDEHTGEAGLDTRVEAFVDMLERSH
ncbi:2-hydroxyglutaryl-CoA dehydratase [Tissierella sp. P1]|uniref:acyl-CoA dehydratase activase-related protein n=1 Tax=unclassified Tissierella TaxID=2638726 RepID=UPI000BA04D01|nr:acyl-CoA dehydratase activase-related protein [Tissierella sp. P1]MDU5083166.1 acyl-CoA dehydratase activase-related protein [Bacillota bacterium]OZV10728.1 2-hydroxyglutaryl-CoA dehydratase [Tissierella sp. P1]